MFNVKWFRLRIHEHDPDRTVIEHGNEFMMVYTRNVEPELESYVLPSQCEHVFYIDIPGKVGWSYVIRYDPRGMPIKYNVVEEDGIEEEDDVEEKGVEQEEDRFSIILQILCILNLESKSSGFKLCILEISSRIFSLDKSEYVPYLVFKLE